MTQLERALRGALAGRAPVPVAGFEARMVRAVLARRRRPRATPILLAGAVAITAIATLLIGRDREPASPPIARTAAPAAGTVSINEMWELVIQLRRSRSLPVVEEEEPEPVPQPQPRKPKRQREVVPPACDEVSCLVEPERACCAAFDCGDDPLCPLVAPHSARVSISSHPSGAAVLIDGQHLGRTPFEAELVPGRHRIEVSAGRGKRRVFTVDLGVGQRRHLTAEL